MTLTSIVRLGFCITLLSLALPARGQELVKAAPETNVSERVRVLESELERQNAKLDQLQKTLLQQQATIQALLDKLSVRSTATETEQVSKGGLPPLATASDPAVAVTPESQTPT